MKKNKESVGQGQQGYESQSEYQFVKGRRVVKRVDDKLGQVFKEDAYCSNPNQPDDQKS